MTWGIIAVLALGLLLTYIIFQETRSHLRWRELVAQGNVWAIHELVSNEIDRWRRMRPPAGTPLPLWAGVQTMELVAIGRDHIQVVCGTEGEYRMVGARREQVATPLEAAMRLAAKVIEMVMYDIPEVKVNVVRVDVYSSFASPNGSMEQGCILTAAANREQANSADWDTNSAQEILSGFSTGYDVDEVGLARPVDPGPPLENEPTDVAMPPEVQRRRGTQRHSDSEKG
jgi:hypothetical protein